MTETLSEVLGQHILNVMETMIFVAIILKTITKAVNRLEVCMHLNFFKAFDRTQPSKCANNSCRFTYIEEVCFKLGG